MNELTIEVLKDYLHSYRLKLKAEYYISHKKLRLGKTVLGLTDISEAYFCEKKVELYYNELNHNGNVTAIDGLLIDGLKDSWLLSLNMNDVFLFSMLAEPNTIEIKEGIIIVNIITQHELTNPNYVNNNDEVYARTICYCMLQGLNEFKVNPVLMYRLVYKDSSGKNIKEVLRAFNLTTKVKARNDIEFVVDYWLEKRKCIPSKVQVKHELCTYKDICDSK